LIKGEKNAVSVAPSALMAFFKRVPRARRLTLGYKYVTATRLYQAALFYLSLLKLCVRFHVRFH
jgi:hypothetical protein